MNRKFGASIAALALATGLAACSDNADDQATEEVMETETNVEVETSQVELESEEAEADEETTEITLQDGSTVLVPTAALEAGDEVGLDNWGDPINAENKGDKWLLEYDAEKNIAYSPETGAQPIVGEIASFWKENGGLDYEEIGMPTAGEVKTDDNDGWTQEFENGTIDWVEEQGEFVANVNK